MKNILRFVGVGAVALSLVAVAGVALAQSNSSIDDVGGSIFDTVSLDLKVNGQDGPVTVAAGSRVVVSWISEGAARCRGNWSRNDIKSSGTVAGRISRSVVIKAACIDKEGNRDDDSVVVNVEGKAQIELPSTTVPQTSSSSADKSKLENNFNRDANVLLEVFAKEIADFRQTIKDNAVLVLYEKDADALIAYLKSQLSKTRSELVIVLQKELTHAELYRIDGGLGDRITSLGQEMRSRLNLIKQKHTTPTPSAQPTATTTQTATSGNVGTGNVGVTTAVPPKLSATAPTIVGTRTVAGDKLYPGQMSITATISNSGGQLTNPVSARFQFSTNNVNWYDWVEVGPITATPRNVSYGWEGGTGSFYYRLCIGGGVDNCSAPTYIEIVYKEGAFFGVSRELAGVAVPATDVWAFLKAWLGR